MSDKKNVLVLNCGSSSFKFAIIDTSDGDTKISGLAERLNSNDATITIKHENKKTEKLTADNSHAGAINHLVNVLREKDLIESISAIGHRVVHGGEAFTESSLITDNVIKNIQKVSALAPLHNPANLTGIEAATSAFPSVPQVAVFDTAFHQSIPPHAYLYAIDYKLYKELGVRKYGFHGTSHYYVAHQAAEYLGMPINQSSFITVHLGNGCSVCAIENGQSVDTSLGLTPLEGLAMGTRSGDIDPGLLIFLMNQHGYSADELDNLLNKKSGLLGLSQISNDCRELEEALNNEDQKIKKQAKLALDVFSYRVAKYIASYTCALTHLNGIVFTGGIGENSSYIRQTVCQFLSLLSVSVDQNANNEARFGKLGEIQDSNSKHKILVIPTNEEWVIAQDAARLAIK